MVLCQFWIGSLIHDHKDEVPNQLLAKDLVASNDIEGVEIIAEHLLVKNANIQIDCLKVLYEIGYLNPELISQYYPDFVRLLQHRNNRLVWGAMIALSTIAKIRADDLFKSCDEIIKAVKTGSVITQDNGIKTLALISAAHIDYQAKIFPFLLDHLHACRPKDVPQRAESISISVNKLNCNSYLKVLEGRIIDLSPTGLTRIKKIFKHFENLP